MKSLKFSCFTSDACRLAPGRDPLISQRTLFEPFDFYCPPPPSSPTFVIGYPSSFYFLRHPWPCDMAGQCNRHRKKGGQCPSPSKRLRTGSASLPAAGVGALRREPEGPCHGQHGFGYFCRNKSSSAAGPTPGIYSSLLHSCRPSSSIRSP